MDKQKIHCKVKFGNFLVLNESFPVHLSLRDLMHASIKNLASGYKDAKFDFIYNQKNVGQMMSFSLSDIIDNKDNHYFQMIQVGHFSATIHIKENYITSTEMVGRLIFDPNCNEIMLLDKQKGIFEKKTLINSFSSLDKTFVPSLKSAYCNAGNCMIVAGGETTENPEQFCTEPAEEVSFFDSAFGIRYETLEIRKLPNLPEPKSVHSMIFIPNDFVCIIGGTNSKTCYCLNLATERYVRLPDLNFKRAEASLCVVNESYLFCFFGLDFQQKFHNSIEKLNFRNNDSVWEMVDFKVNDSALDFKPQFFGTCFGKNINQIILLGNNIYSDIPSAEVKNYCFDESTNTIYSYFSSFYTFDKALLEKFFLPMNQDIAVNIPLTLNCEIYYFFDNCMLAYQNENWEDLTQKDEIFEIMRSTRSSSRKHTNVPVPMPKVSDEDNYIGATLSNRKKKAGKIKLSKVEFGI